MGTYQPLVSIVILTYNQEKFLPQCISSVVGQSYTNWEIILVDDNSTDLTKQIAVEMVQEERIGKVLVHTNNYGPYRLSDSYNEALELASGSLVSILEGDDYWHPDKLSEQVKFFERENVVLCYSNIVVVNEIGKELSKTSYESRFSSDLLNNQPVGKKLEHYLNLENKTPSVTVTIRKSCLDSIGGFQSLPNCSTVDFPTYFKLCLLGEFRFSTRALGFYRIHTNNVSKGKRSEYQLAFVKFIKQNARSTPLKDVAKSCNMDLEKYIRNLETKCALNIKKEHVSLSYATVKSGNISIKTITSLVSNVFYMLYLKIGSISRRRE